jgi:hypothetical protein
MRPGFPNLDNCADAVLLEVLLKRRKEIFTELIARSLRATFTERVSRLEWRRSTARFRSVI